MIPYRTFSTLFSIGPFHIEPWGLMAALGFLAALWIIAREAKKRALDMNDAYGIALSMLIGGILGGRIGWILTEAPKSSFIDYLKIWNGGLISYGAIIGGFLLAYAFMRYKKLDSWKYLDVFAIGLPLGMALCRVGCYLIGDHVGKATTMPWAIPLNGMTHPVVLYEIILLLGIFSLMLYLKNKGLKSGSLFSIYIIAYSFGRFFIDFFRTDPTYYGLTIAQYTSMALFITFLYVVYRIKRGIK